MDPISLRDMFEGMNALLVEITPGLAVIISMGVGIGTALAILVFIGKQIERAFDYSPTRKSKDEEEKPKRKQKNEWYQDPLTCDIEAWSDPADDGDIVYYEYTDEEVLKR